MENPPDPPFIHSDSQLDCVEGASNWLSLPSLLSTTGGDNTVGKALGDFRIPNTGQNDSNLPANAGSHPVAETLQAAQHVQQTLFDIQAQQEAFREASLMAHAQRNQIKAQAAERRQIARMQQFLESGDPILMAEAMAWAQVNPNVLNMTALQLSLLETERSHQHESQAINSRSQFKRDGHDHPM